MRMSCGAWKSTLALFISVSAGTEPWEKDKEASAPTERHSSVFGYDPAKKRIDAFAMTAYTRIDQIWGPDQWISLRMVDGTSLGSDLPLSYLSRSGTFDLQLVKDIAQALIVETIQLLSADKSVITELSVEPLPGCYFVVCKDEPTRVLTPAQGPQGSRRFLPLTDEDETSDSRSATSTARHLGFRTELVGRDCLCVVTGADWHKCIASHIVPFTRLDIYHELYQKDLREDHLFRPHMGILLQDDLSRSFASFKWSIYHRDGKYHLHAPVLNATDQRYHGKQLEIGRISHYRTLGPREMPDPILCHWHWTQCMQAHVRGYAIWPRLDTIAQVHIQEQ